MSLYLWDQRGKSRAPRSGSQSKRRIRFFFSFRRASCRLPATWIGLKSAWFVWISVTGVATRTSKKKRFKQAKIYVRNTCWLISFSQRHDYDVKCRGTFNRGCNCKTSNFSFSLIGIYMGNNSIPGEFGFIGKIEWGRIMAIKL